MRRTGVLVSLVLVLLAGAWLARDAVLSAIGDRLVSEDNVVPTDWVVLSGAAAPLTALVGMYLYRESAARHARRLRGSREPGGGGGRSHRVGP